MTLLTFRYHVSPFFLFSFFANNKIDKSLLNLMFIQNKIKVKTKEIIFTHKFRRRDGLAGFRLYMTMDSIQD
jgi:hypothetical protein